MGRWVCSPVVGPYQRSPGCGLRLLIPTVCLLSASGLVMLFSCTMCGLLRVDIEHWGPETRTGPTDPDRAWVTFPVLDEEKRSSS